MILKRRNIFGSPWHEVEQLQREMNRLFTNTFSDAPRRFAPAYPAMNAWTNEDGAVITVELPGVNPDDIDISVVGQTLTLSGDRQPDAFKEGDKYHRRERSYGKFSRSIELPFLVETDKVDALFDKGILHISLPRAEADKPQKIVVKVA